MRRIKNDHNGLCLINWNNGVATSEMGKTTGRANLREWKRISVLGKVQT